MFVCSVLGFVLQNFCLSKATSIIWWHYAGYEADPPWAKNKHFVSIFDENVGHIIACFWLSIFKFAQVLVVIRVFVIADNKWKKLSPQYKIAGKTSIPPGFVFNKWILKISLLADSLWLVSFLDRSSCDMAPGYPTKIRIYSANSIYLH